MIQTWNADDFQLRLTQSFKAADEVRAVLEQAHPPGPGESPESAVQARRELWLECHARDFVIDHILFALNWQLRPSLNAGEYIQANLVTEQNPVGVHAGLKDETVESRRRLDYFGYEHGSDRPLLLVEAKRPRLLLTGSSSPLSRPDGHPLAERLSMFLTKARDGEDVQEHLTAEWREAVIQVRDYCRTVAAAADWPARAVLTNGEWLIAFVEPREAFGEGADDSIDYHSILVFESRELMLANAAMLWDQLDFATLTRVDRWLMAAQVPFVVDPRNVESCSHGLRIAYTQKRSNWRKAPLLTVSPLLFIRSSDGACIQVGTKWEDEVPADGRDAVVDHLQAVAERALALKQDVERILGKALPVISVEAHCSNEEAFRKRPAVQVLPHDVGEIVLLLTGTETHFVRADTPYKECRYHSHAAARCEAVAQEASASLESTIEPRSYFVDRSPFHCAHQAVYAVKEQAVTEANRERCGPRSTGPGGAFCEIWRMEQLLCCRACVFQVVCFRASVFSLPCPELVPLTTRGKANP